MSNGMGRKLVMGSARIGGAVVVLCLRNASDGDFALFWGGTVLVLLVLLILGTFLPKIELSANGQVQTGNEADSRQAASSPSPAQ